MMKEESKTFQEFLLKKGVIKQKDILEIEAARKDTNVSLGAIALNRGLLTSVEIRHVLDVQSKTTGKFGEVAIELKLLDHDQMQELLAEQKKVNLDPGEILVLKGRQAGIDGAFSTGFRAAPERGITLSFFAREIMRSRNLVASLIST